MQVYEGLNELKEVSSLGEDGAKRQVRVTRLANPETLFHNPNIFTRSMTAPTLPV